MSSETTSDLLTRMQRYIAEAHHSLAQRDMAALEALSPQGDAIAAALSKVDAASAQAHATELQQLAGEMSKLVEAMEAAKAGMADTMKSADNHHRATRAYRSAPDSGAQGA